MTSLSYKEVQPLLVAEKTSNRKEGILNLLSERLAHNPFILSARGYGSFFTGEGSVDLDLAVMVPSRHSVIEEETYLALRETRASLCRELKIDVDLVPHTIDEATDLNSPLYNPRYHPSLFFGRDIKNSFPLPERINPTQNVAAYVLLDNRTITRRQVLRDCDLNNWRIFLAKLRHAPGNALTFSSLSEGRGYYVDPSDTVRSFRTFDQVFGTDSTEIFNLFTRSKQIIEETGDLPLEIAIKLLRWHDSLVATVLGHYPPALKEFFDEESI